MYCGDETGSFIGDIGSHSARFGYGGDNAPTYVTPTLVGRKRHPDDASVNQHGGGGSYTIPTSCYSQRWCRDNHDDKYHFSHPMRMPDYEAFTGSNSSSSSNSNMNVGSGNDHNRHYRQPLTDPVQFLQQGDSIADWDAYEHMWLNAMDALSVRETLKHTTGGGGSRPTTATAASGLSSTTLATTVDAAGTGDSKCVHPFLVVSPGCTHAVGRSTDTGSSKQRKQKELVQLTELVMETLDARAVFLAPTPMLAAFAHGRQSCLVVDIGAGGTRVTPVVDGLLLYQAQRRSGRGGDWLDHCAWQALESSQDALSTAAAAAVAAGTTAANATSGSFALTPRYQLGLYNHQPKKPSRINAIFHRWAVQNDVLYELRSSEHVAVPQWWYDPTVPFQYYNSTKTARADAAGAASNTPAVEPAASIDAGSGGGGGTSDMDIDSTIADAKGSPANTKTTANVANGSQYQLPDGTMIDLTTRVGKDLCRLPELFFTEDYPFQETWSDDQVTSSQGILHQHATLSNLPLHKLVHASLSAIADVDVRKDLAASIVLVGGCAVTRHLEQRLSLELPRLLSAAYKPKVLASRYTVERQAAAWIGGSILTSLGSFQQLWLSKAEYEEYGATLAVQRFP